MAVVWTGTVLFSFKAEKLSSTGHWLPLGSSNIDGGNSSSSIIVLITESENYNIATQKIKQLQVDTFSTTVEQIHRHGIKQPLQKKYNGIKGVNIDPLNSQSITGVLN